MICVCYQFFSNIKDYCSAVAQIIKIGWFFYAYDGLRGRHFQKSSLTNELNTLREDIFAGSKFREFRELASNSRN